MASIEIEKLSDTNRQKTMLYILKIKNIFNSKLLFMLTLLLPFTSQAMVSFHIPLHSHSYYFFTENKNETDLNLNDAIFKLRNITSESHNYCAKCGRLARDTYLIRGPDRRYCFVCINKVSKDERTCLTLDRDFH